MSHIPSIRKIKDFAEMQKILEIARLDNDGVELPTHVVEKNGEIVGAASLNVLPVLMTWHHSSKVNTRDSIMLKHMYDTLMEERNQGKPFVVLCNKNSPYNPVMKSLGYNPIWETEIFLGGK